MSLKRYAYLIGANGPEEMRLKHAEKDVIRLADALKGPPCQFTGVEFVIAHSRIDSLKGLKNIAQQCEPSDLLLIHFSGHALFDEQLYLLCNETDVNDLVSTAIDIGAIKAILRRSKSRYKVLILDCAHAAAAHEGPLKGGTVILSACARYERTQEIDELDGGSGFLSWAIRSGCTTNFHEASSFPDLNVLSLDDLWQRWIPKALEYVNSLPSVVTPLPPPILLSQQESSYSNEIWLTDPPPLSRDTHTGSDETRRKYLSIAQKERNENTFTVSAAQSQTQLASPSIEAKSARDLEIFCSYAHKDEKLWIELTKRLKPLVRGGSINYWYDRNIDAGSNYSGLLSTCQRRGNQVKYTHDERRRIASPSRRKSKPQSVGR